MASAEQGLYGLNTSTPYAKPVGTTFQDFVGHGSAPEDWTAGDSSAL